MKTETNPQNVFTIDLSPYERVGFHATSLASAPQIERFGFLPSKFLKDEEHAELLSFAEVLGIDAGAYRSWLGMRSVTFTRELGPAVAHARAGFSAGQGTKQVVAVVSAIEQSGDERHRSAATRVRQQLEQLQSSPPVIYAVDLSRLRRLVDDEYQPLYQYYWHPDQPLPQISDIGPDRLIGRLDLQ